MSLLNVDPSTDSPFSFVIASEALAREEYDIKANGYKDPRFGLALRTYNTFFSEEPPVGCTFVVSSDETTLPLREEAGYQSISTIAEALEHQGLSTPNSLLHLLKEDSLDVLLLDQLGHLAMELLIDRAKVLLNQSDGLLMINHTAFAPLCADRSIDTESLLTQIAAVRTKLMTAGFNNVALLGTDQIVGNVAKRPVIFGACLPNLG